ncbi:torsin-1A [Coccinella septempunctata]|uniref:torsin-1A n=1 Tax=Coccinella septempunctata TaxID=41139 RepID=UPI001D0981F8|nr:torsin-1A [Coccinella septempunctata]
MYLKALVLIICTNNCYGFLDVLVGVASYGYDAMKCRMVDTCCTEKEIPANFKALEENLKKNVFGQPLVESTVIKALRAHWDKNYEPEKALTISFHGGPGIGKNYVVKFIEESLYRKGMESPHVHNFNARLDFPEIDKVNLYKANLQKWIIGNVSNCPKQMFVFDEVHQMPPGILDAIKPFIDHISFVSGTSFKRSIFVFLSNTGSTAINEHALNLWNMGVERDYLKLNVFEKLIAQGAFNEKGGFHYSETIKSNLIDHYIPFLPLMKSHVVLCIKNEFSKLDKFYPSDQEIQEVLDFIDWGPDSKNAVFSKTGCKRISQKVRLIAF